MGLPEGTDELIERCTNVSAPLYQAHCTSEPTRHMLTRQVEEHESSLPGRLHSDMPHPSGTCTVCMMSMMRIVAFL